METDELCDAIHRILNNLPIFKDPSDVPFTNGLYFFYQKGEISPHGSNGRIVRVGNHPLSQNNLKKRLRLHYSGNKNSSVFRRYLGGAILRNMNPYHPCLMPEPGKGHWEKQGMKPCEKCKPIELEVSKLLRNDFWFRCVEINDINQRNIFEKKLIATISCCTLCKPSSNWLGKKAYPEEVITSGLWNSLHVFDQNFILKPIELQTFEKLAI